MKTVQSVDLVVKLLLEYHRALVARTRDCGPLRLGFIEDSEKERLKLDSNVSQLVTKGLKQQKITSRLTGIRRTQLSTSFNELQPVP